jgi:ribonuclease HI
MQLDPRAIQIRTDGSCYRERRLISGCAAIVEYPEHLQRDREQIVDFGCAESSINRMELLAVIRSLKWVRDKNPWKDVTRVQIISDSKYVLDNISRVHEWRKNKWRNRHDQPLENSDLWKEFLSVFSRTKITVHFGWTPGKKSPALKEIDKAAKTAALRGGPDTDRGYSRGTISRSVVKAAATPFPAHGQTAIIRPYRKTIFTRAAGENKVRFDVYSEVSNDYIQSCYAFAPPALACELHRQNGYRVRFNANPRYPQIEEIIESLNLPKS